MLPCRSHFVKSVVGDRFWPCPKSPEHLALADELSYSDDAGVGLRASFYSSHTYIADKLQPLSCTLLSYYRAAHIGIRDYSPPKLVPSPKSKNPKTSNPNRKLIIRNSKDESVWDESSCSPIWHSSCRAEGQQMSKSSGF